MLIFYFGLTNLFMFFMARFLIVLDGCPWFHSRLLLLVPLSKI